MCSTPNGRSQHGHGVRESVLMGDDHVGIAFHHQGGLLAALAADRLAGQIQPVKQLALREKRRFGRVDVLRRAGRAQLGQHAAADAHRPALRIADRKQQAGP